MAAMVNELQRRPITVDEYHKMLDVGVLREGERVELLRGDLVRKVTIGDRHRMCVIRLTELLVVRFHGRAAVQVQSPVVVLDDSEPEPDVALLARNNASIGGKGTPRHAYPADVFALIEVTDASRNRDTRFKRKLYAEAGIREYWVVDLIDDAVHVNRNPDRVARRYRTTSIARSGADIAFDAFPDDPIAVDQMLKP
jgi:Uma2 family endonuclease